jgi:hypothetical protein
MMRTGRAGVIRRSESQKGWCGDGDACEFQELAAEELHGAHSCHRVAKPLIGSTRIRR